MTVVDDSPRLDVEIIIPEALQRLYGSAFNLDGTRKRADKRPQAVYDFLTPEDSLDLITMIQTLRDLGRAGFLGVDEDGHLVFSRVEEAISIFGGTRMGKTLMLFISIATNPGCTFVTLTRPDDAEKILPAATLKAEAFGGKVYILDLSGSENGSAANIEYDPTEDADLPNVALLLSEIMVSQSVREEQSSHFADRCKALVAATLSLANALGHNGQAMYRTLAAGPVLVEMEGEPDENGNPPTEEMMPYEEELHRQMARLQLEKSWNGEVPEGEEYELTARGERLSEHIFWLYQSVFGEGNAADEELSSIRSTAMNALRYYARDTGGRDIQFIDRKLIRQAAEWNMKELVSTFSTVLIMTGKNADMIRPLVSAVLETAIRTWKDIPKDFWEKTGLERPAGLFIAAEEAAIVQIPNLPRLKAEGGGDHIQVTDVWQNPAQVRGIYGANAQAVWTSGGHEVVYAGVGDKEYLGGFELASPKVLKRKTLVVAADRPDSVSNAAAVSVLVEDRVRLTQHLKETFAGRRTSAAEQRYAAVQWAYETVIPARMKAGWGTRKEFNGDYLAEIMGMTKVIHKDVEEHLYTYDQIQNCEDGQVFRRDGNKMGFYRMPVYFEDRALRRLLVDDPAEYIAPAFVGYPQYQYPQEVLDRLPFEIAPNPHPSQFVVRQEWSPAEIGI